MNINVLFDETLFLSDDELCIKSITKKDADDFSKIYLNPNCFKFTPGLAKKTYEETMNILDRYQKGFEEKVFFFPGLYLKDSNKLIGNLEIFNIDKDKEELEIGYRINEEYWNKGYTKKGTAMLVDYLFDKVNVKRLNACAIITNTASNKILKSLGFILYKQTFHEEEWKDKGFVDLNYYYKEKG